MRTTLLCALLVSFLGLFGYVELAAQPKAEVPPVKPQALPKKGGKVAEEKKDDAFDQVKVDQETIQSAGYSDDVKSLTDFFKNHTVTEADKARISAFIKKLGEESFESREQASEDLSKSGVPAIALLRSAQNAKDADPEIVRRCELALKIIEKVPTRSLAIASARLLATKNEDGMTGALLGYLPLADEESVTDEIRNTLAALAIRGGKPDKTLESALENKSILIRGAAAEAFARANDKTSRAKMKEFLNKEVENEVKLLIALALVNNGRDKEIVPSVIKLMADVPSEKGWRAEELMWRIAGEDGPPVSLGGDKANNEKARDEWKKWWDANEKKVDLAKLDQESSYGLTIVCESPRAGGLGRIVALGGDGKERWSVKGLNWPMDAVPLAGKKILIAEHNRNRIFEKEIDGKEIWSENINQPVSVGRLPNGTTWAVGRNQIIEWERGDKSGKKQEFTFLRNEYDIVAGNRLKNGEYVLLTQNQQLLKVDRKGAITKSHGVGGNGVNYYATVDVLPTGKVLVTLMNSITEYDLETGKAGTSFPFQNATTAVRLRNGNTIVGHQNNGKIVELDKEGKPTKWEHKGADASYRPFRAFKR
ncbi:MAG: hypothetical protein EXS09_05490 [Gemmataceae bacterium]|nr:hypothetical protein [Gemmataceae bacterium]